MRRVLVFALVGALMATTVSARRPKDRAGKVDDGVYVDKKYNFQLTLNSDWKYKIGDNDDDYRLTLTQVNYEVPPNYIDAPDYTKIPRTVVYVDTTTLGVAAFVDSLLSESFGSKQKNEIYKEFEILNDNAGGSGLTREEVVTTQRRFLDIGGERAILWAGRVKYRNEVSVSASSMGGKRVYGGFSGCIVGVKKGSNIILMHTICEENYFESIMAEALRMANSLKWVQ